MRRPTNQRRPTSRPARIPWTSWVEAISGSDRSRNDALARAFREPLDPRCGPQLLEDLSGLPQHGCGVAAPPPAGEPLPEFQERRPEVEADVALPERRGGELEAGFGAPLSANRGESRVEPSDLGVEERRALAGPRLVRQADELVDRREILQRERRFDRFDEGVGDDGVAIAELATHVEPVHGELEGYLVAAIRPGDLGSREGLARPEGHVGPHGLLLDHTPPLNKLHPLAAAPLPLARQG